MYVHRLPNTCDKNRDVSSTFFVGSFKLFRSIHKHRPNRTGGGVGLYISDNLDFKIRADLSFDVRSF